MSDKLLRFSVKTSLIAGSAGAVIGAILPQAHALTSGDITAVTASGTDQVDTYVKTNVLSVFLWVLGMIFVFGLIAVILHWAYKGLRWLMAKI